MKLESRGFLGKNIDREEIQQVVGQMSYADWLILYYLAQAMDKKNFGDLLHAMACDMPMCERDSDAQSRTDNSSDDEERGDLRDGGRNRNGYSRDSTLKASIKNMMEMKSLKGK